MDHWKGPSIHPPVDTAWVRVDVPVRRISFPLTPVVRRRVPSKFPWISVSHCGVDQL